MDTGVGGGGLLVTSDWGAICCGGSRVVGSPLFPPVVMESLVVDVDLLGLGADCPLVESVFGTGATLAFFGVSGCVGVVHAGRTGVTALCTVILGVGRKVTGDLGTTGT